MKIEIEHMEFPISVFIIVPSSLIKFDEKQELEFHKKFTYWKDFWFFFGFFSISAEREIWKLRIEHQMAIYGKIISFVFQTSRW